MTDQKKLPSERSGDGNDETGNALPLLIAIALLLGLVIAYGMSTS